MLAHGDSPLKKDFDGPAQTAGRDPFCLQISSPGLNQKDEVGLSLDRTHHTWVCFVYDRLKEIPYPQKKKINLTVTIT